jgi:hypothetical protein
MNPKQKKIIGQRINNRKMYQMGFEAGQLEYKQFILNVLKGIDIADKQMGNKGGGTKAIRLAIKSRIIKV